MRLLKWCAWCLLPAAQPDRGWVQHPPLGPPLGQTRGGGGRGPAQPPLVRSGGQTEEALSLYIRNPWQPQPWGKCVAQCNKVLALGVVQPAA